MEFRATVEETEKSGDAEGGYQQLDDGVGKGYTKLEQNERVADDKLMQASLLNVLVKDVQKLYTDLRNAYEERIPEDKEESWKEMRAKSGTEILPNTTKIILHRYSDDPMKAYDRLLWRIEIDVENIEDLISHLQNRKEQTLREKFKSLFPRFF